MDPFEFDSLTDIEKGTFIENVKFPVSIKLEYVNLVKDPKVSVRSSIPPPKEYGIMFNLWLKSDKEYSTNNPDEDFVLFLMESENPIAKVVLEYLGYK